MSVCRQNHPVRQKVTVTITKVTGRKGGGGGRGSQIPGLNSILCVIHSRVGMVEQEGE